MDKVEIDATLARTHQKVVKDLAKLPVLGWLITLGVLPLLLLTQVVPVIVFFAGLMSLISSTLTFSFLGDFKGIQKRRAAVLWSRLPSQVPFNDEPSAATRELWKQIGNIYAYDPHGAFFPLPQAIRLLDAHHRQQKRVGLVSQRLDDLNDLKVRLSEKIIQLRELGADHEEGLENLQRIETDAQALQPLQDQIEASCRRLEMILISVQTAFKTRQLQREIAELGTRATSSATLSTLAPENELSEIEAQIGREIETFLRLERETERHFG